MKLMVLDGNSLVNRAFFGIKLLTTKDGRYTNAIFGFQNILLNLLAAHAPDASTAAAIRHAAAEIRRRRSPRGGSKCDVSLFFIYVHILSQCAEALHVAQGFGVSGADGAGAAAQMAHGAAVHGVGSGFHGAQFILHEGGTPQARAFPRRRR